MSASAPLSADLGSRPEPGFARLGGPLRPTRATGSRGAGGDQGFPHARQTEALRLLAELTQ